MILGGLSASREALSLQGLLFSRTRAASRTRASTVETGVRIQELLSPPVRALFMDDPWPGAHLGPPDESWLGVGGLLSPSVFSRFPSVLPDGTGTCVVFNVHALGAGDDSSTEYRACCLESSVASWRASQVTCSEIRTDGPVVPVIFLSASGDALTSVSPRGPSASGVGPFPQPSLVLALVV